MTLLAAFYRVADLAINSTGLTHTMVGVINIRRRGGRTVLDARCVVNIPISYIGCVREEIEGRVTL